MATFSAMAGGSPFVRGGNLNPGDPIGSYNSAYSAAAQTNQNLYSTAMSGYAQMIAQANAAQQANQRGYLGLQRNVMQRLKGSNRANLQDIADQFTKLSGQFTQSMINRGLGNTTVQESVQRGVASDYAQERTRSQGAFAQLQADYLSRIGLSRLQAEQQGIGMMSGLQSDQMHYLASIQAPYPDPGMYAAMAAQMGGGGMGGGMGMPGPPSPATSLAGWHAPARGGGYSPDVGGVYSPGFGGWATGYGGNQVGFMQGGGDPYGAIGGGLGSLLGPGVAGMAEYSGDYGGGGDF